MTRSRTHRYLSILVRTVHIAAVVGTFTSVYQQDEHTPWAITLVGSGLLMCIDDLYRFGTDWFRYTQAWVIFTKLSSFIILYGLGYPQTALWTALILGSLISHAPGELRHQPIAGEPGPCARKIQ